MDIETIIKENLREQRTNYKNDFMKEKEKNELLKKKIKQICKTIKSKNNIDRKNILNKLENIVDI